MTLDPHALRCRYPLAISVGCRLGSYESLMLRCLTNYTTCSEDAAAKVMAVSLAFCCHATAKKLLLQLNESKAGATWTACNRYYSARGRDKTMDVALLARAFNNSNSSGASINHSISFIAAFIHVVGIVCVLNVVKHVKIILMVQYVEARNSRTFNSPLCTSNAETCATDSLFLRLSNRAGDSHNLEDAGLIQRLGQAGHKA